MEHGNRKRSSLSHALRRCESQCGALVRVGDLIANKLAEPANIYNPILYSLEFS
ncbi:unnamed protein product [Brassica oleracea var. botrytis]|uniref:Uncharacterized protein n=2 Tax=Brassica TaxID=3705 RepID=A0A3P6C2U9_BRAOL|nr:unnamed protein product [Brassica napus]VDD08460.1 unnamed protein product [Brassica oleracea]